MSFTPSSSKLSYDIFSVTRSDGILRFSCRLYFKAMCSPAALCILGNPESNHGGYLTKPVERARLPRHLLRYSHSNAIYLLYVPGLGFRVTV